MLFVNVLVALAAAGLVSAQTPPECVTTCVGQAATANGCSGLDDVTCICTNPQVIEDATPCLSESCTPEELSAAAELQAALCSGASPSGSAAPSSSAAPSGSATPSSSASGSAAPSSSASRSASAAPSSSGRPSGSASGGASGSASGSQPEPSDDGSAAGVKAAWAPVAVAAIAALAL